MASGCITAIVRLYDDKGNECFDRRGNATTKITSSQADYIPKNYTLVSEDQLFMFKQYLHEQVHRERVRNILFELSIHLISC